MDSGRQDPPKLPRRPRAGRHGRLRGCGAARRVVCPQVSSSYAQVQRVLSGITNRTPGPTTGAVSSQVRWCCEDVATPRYHGNMTSNRERVTQYLAEHAGVSVRVAARDLGVSYSTVSRVRATPATPRTATPATPEPEIPEGWASASVHGDTVRQLQGRGHRARAAEVTGLQGAGHTSWPTRSASTPRADATPSCSRRASGTSTRTAS